MRPLWPWRRTGENCGSLSPPAIDTTIFVFLRFLLLLLPPSSASSIVRAKRAEGGGGGQEGRERQMRDDGDVNPDFGEEISAAAAAAFS
jgi:hypothetical protein